MMEFKLHGMNEFYLGLVAGEGSFGIRLNETHGKFDISVVPRFSMHLHSDDRGMLEELQKSIGSGTLYEYSDRDALQFEMVGWKPAISLIRKIESIESKLWEMSDKYEKYLDWKNYVEMHGSSPDTLIEARTMVYQAKQLNRGNRGRDVEEWLEVVDSSATV